MAIVQLGGGITSIHGSFAGSTFVRSKGGTIWKGKSNRPGGSSTSSKQKIFWTNILSQAWTYDLTAAQRKAWSAIAKTMPYTTTTGRIAHHSGHTLFISQNYYLIFFGLAANHNPPTSFSVGTPTTLIVFDSISGPGGDISLALTGISLGASDKAVFEVTPPLKPGIKSAKSKFLTMPSLYTINAVQSITTDYINTIGTLPSAAGQRIFAEAFIVNTTTGSTSTSLQISALWT